MINYYKILGIENFASVNEVKEAYKTKIRQYHPDINPSEDAKEIAKYLNLAKDQLTEEAKKTAYDKELKLAYAIEINRLKNKPKQRLWDTLSVFERKQKIEEARELKAKLKYEESLKSYPLWMRFSASIAAILIGLQLFYSNYILMHPGYETVIISFSVMLFVGGVAYLSNVFYQHFAYKSKDHVVSFNYTMVTRLIFFLLIPLGIFAVINLSEYRKTYFLENNFDYYQADILEDESKGSMMVYTYEINGVRYTKAERNALFWQKRYPDKKLIIKYAIPDPRITQIVRFKSLE